MTDARDLVRIHIEEQGVISRRYYSQTSLRVKEAWENRPKAKAYRRDRVLYRLQRLRMQVLINELPF